MLPIASENSNIAAPLINPLPGCLSCLSRGRFSVKIPQFTQLDNCNSRDLIVLGEFLLPVVTSRVQT